MLAFNPIITGTTPSYSIPHHPLINTVIVLTASISVIEVTGGYNRKNDPACMCCSKIRSLLEVWLRLLMSTRVEMPGSWTTWQIIFTASHHHCSIPFFFSLSLSSIRLSDRALFCLKAFSSGLLPELPLRCFQRFLDIPHHSFPLSPFILCCGILLGIYISKPGCPAHGERTGVTRCYWISTFWSGFRQLFRTHPLCVGATADKSTISGQRCSTEIQAGWTFPQAEKHNKQTDLTALSMFRLFLYLFHRQGSEIKCFQRYLYFDIFTYFPLLKISVNTFPVKIEKAELLSFVFTVWTTLAGWITMKF